MDPHLSARVIFTDLLYQPEATVGSEVFSYVDVIHNSLKDRISPSYSGLKLLGKSHLSKVEGPLQGTIPDRLFKRS